MLIRIEIYYPVSTEPSRLSNIKYSVKKRKIWSHLHHCRLELFLHLFLISILIFQMSFWGKYMSIWFNKEKNLTNANYLFIGKEKRFFFLPVAGAFGSGDQLRCPEDPLPSGTPGGAPRSLWFSSLRAPSPHKPFT